MDLQSLLIRCAQEEGFPLAGVVDIDLAFAEGPHSFQNHVNVFHKWMKAGRAAGMQYLARGAERRSDPRLLFPEAQSVLAVALPYARKPAGQLDPQTGVRYARYLQGPDYHLEISKKLEATLLKAKTIWEQDPERPPLRWKVCVDTSAVLERSWAALAGLGWIGKNTLLIHPRLGSYLFLGEVLINHKTGQGPAPLPNFCGHCTRCLKSCPTQALDPKLGLDSNLCISYWNLEKRGELSLSPETRKKIGPWIAGCDLCQEACPFNFKPSQLPEQVTPGATSVSDWKTLLTESETLYRERVKSSALNRVKPPQFSRNLAITLINFLETIHQKERILFLKEHQSILQYRLTHETDPGVKHLWEMILNTLQEPFDESEPDPQTSQHLA